MRIRVIDEKCQGHNRCWDISTELFELDELGNAHEKNGGKVPPELEEKARLAVLNCPERAIVIEEE